jgi:hypothetical protein
MHRKLLFVLLGLVLLPGLLLAQSTGKVVGKVTDRETGEALIGANIIIEGTNFGAATDVNGTYVILNVPVGTYTLRCSYVGYTNVTIHNIGVSSGLTSERNFQLPSTAVQVQPVEITAERPLINKSATNAVRITRSEDIQNLAVRGVGNIVALQAGVVSQGGVLYVRGGRRDETQYYLDGVKITNPLYGGQGANIIDNAVEEIQVQAGGYNAEFGGANAGIISASSKIGSQDLHASLELITDNWGGATKLERTINGPHNMEIHPSSTSSKILDTYSYGYSEYVLTLNGPIIPGNPNYKFFLAGNQQFNRTQPGVFNGYSLFNITDPTGIDTLTLDVPAGRNYFDYYYRRWSLQGNITADMRPFTFKLSGSWSRDDSHGNGGWFNPSRGGLTRNLNGTLNLRVTHLINPTTYYNINVNYFNNYSKTMDADLQDYWMAYGDSTENAKYGYTLAANSQNKNVLNAFGFTFAYPGAVAQGEYVVTQQSNIGVSADFVHQIGRTHEIKFGGEFTRYTVRLYDQPNAFASFSTFRNLPGGTPDAVVAQSLRANIYGYDIWGAETSSDVTYTDSTGVVSAAFAGPQHPVIAAAYLQDKIEFEDLIINVGLRFDYIDSKGKQFADALNVGQSQNNLLVYDQLQDVPTSKTVSPRIGFSFPVSDQTVFHSQYGKFVQQSRFRDIYRGWTVVANDIFGGFAIINPVGWGLRPERTTQYELGFTQVLGTSASFDITLYYKDIIDQIQIRQIASTPSSYYAWVNGDFATSKGLEFKFNLRRTNRVAIDMSYALSDARGTGSSSSNQFNVLYGRGAQAYMPQYIQALEFDQRHRGALNFDYRYGLDDGPTLFGTKLLERFGLNMLFTFNSGHPYTRVNPNNPNVPVEETNASTTPWNYQLDMKLDKMVKLGPLDVDFYIYVINVLGSRNAPGVYTATGDPSSNGYLESETGKLATIQYGEPYAQMYRQINLNNSNYGTPRQIRLGLRVNY